MGRTFLHLLVTRGGSRNAFLCVLRKTVRERKETRCEIGKDGSRNRKKECEIEIDRGEQRWPDRAGQLDSARDEKRKEERRKTERERTTGKHRVSFAGIPSFLSSVFSRSC